MKTRAVQSTLPGVISYLHVDDGSTIAEGDRVLAIECMKQMHDITAPIAGTIRLRVALGDLVEQQQVIFEIESE